LFGLRLLQEEISASPVGGNALVMIMAHEWGHILQFQRGVAEPGKGMELSADFMAGWWLGMKAVWRVPMLDWATAARSLFGKGDYEFNSPRHHGTPSERVSLMTRGYELSANLGVTSSAQALREAVDAV
jgi:hypothetical protein